MAWAIMALAEPLPSVEELTRSRKRMLPLSLISREIAHIPIGIAEAHVHLSGGHEHGEGEVSGGGGTRALGAVVGA